MKEASQAAGKGEADPFDFSDPNNRLFQIVLKDKSAQDMVKRNEDRAYSIVEGAMVSEENDSHDTLALMSGRAQFNKKFDPSGVYYTSADLAKFREITGYNLVAAGGHL